MSNLFNTDSTEEWEDHVRPFIDDVIKTCRTDDVLISTLENLLNHVDSDIMEKVNFSFRLEPIMNVISKPTYYTGTLKNAYQEEIKKVRELHERLSVFQTMVKSEFRSTPKPDEKEPVKDRLPNASIDLSTVYAVAENSRKRL